MTNRLATLTETYQAYLEGSRAHPEDEELARCVAEAKRELEIEWLRVYAS